MVEYARKRHKPVGFTDEQSTPQKEITEETAKTRAEAVQESQEGLVLWVPVIISAALLLYILQNKDGSSVKLGKWFTLDELTATNTGLPNIPPAYAIANLQRIVANVLDPLRDEVGPLIVTSGYRSPDVNAKVGGSPTSQHMEGEAVDVVPTASSKEDVIAALRELPVDQVITYYDTSHIHISYSHSPRGEFLYKSSSGYEVV